MRTLMDETTTPRTFGQSPSPCLAEDAEWTLVGQASAASPTPAPVIKAGLRRNNCAATCRSDGQVPLRQTETRRPRRTGSGGGRRPR